jgi:hypothetical protein
MEHALVLRGKCVRANMRCNLGQTVPARAGDPTADSFDEVIEKWPLIIARHNSVLVLLFALLETLKATSLINFHVAILVSRLGSQFGWSSNHSSKSMAYISPFDF